jgi:hypothetical protein
MDGEGTKNDVIYRTIDAEIHSIHSNALGPDLNGV